MPSHCVSCTRTWTEIVLGGTDMDDLKVTLVEDSPDNWRWYECEKEIDGRPFVFSVMATDAAHAKRRAYEAPLYLWRLNVPKTSIHS
jgi:hypothetical protein